MRRRILFAVLALSLATVALGCERKAEDGEAGGETTTQADQEQQAEGGADESDGEARTITIQPVDNEMRYQQTEITVEPGQKVRIVFDNIATDPAMKHNVVQLDTDDSNVAMEVAQAGWSLPAQDYVPDHEAIIAHTSMSEPGETVEVTFTAPEEPGEYLYICTYPGHYPTRKGTLIVEE